MAHPDQGTASGDPLARVLPLRAANADDALGLAIAFIRLRKQQMPHELADRIRRTEALLSVEPQDDLRFGLAAAYVANDPDCRRMPADALALSLSQIVAGLAARNAVEAHAV